MIPAQCLPHKGTNKQTHTHTLQIQWKLSQHPLLCLHYTSTAAMVVAMAAGTAAAKFPFTIAFAIII